MKEKINIAELLKDCPKDMELDCTMYSNMYFDEIVENTRYPIICYTIYEGIRTAIYITKYGTFNTHGNSKCVIFPKGKTTWEGFVPPCTFKDGDIIFIHANCLKVGVGNSWISIFKEKRNGGVATYVDYAEDGSDYYSDLDGDKPLLCMESDILRQRLATEEEKQKLFDAIKDNGYKWNSETRTLDKLTKFKVGDKIKHKSSNLQCTIGEYSKGISAYRTNIGLSLTSKDLEQWELVPNKFDITTLKPFHKVLCRDSSEDIWTAGFYSHYETQELSSYHVVNGTGADQCIPYESNEHLLGTTNNCDSFYKTWEE